MPCSVNVTGSGIRRRRLTVTGGTSDLPSARSATIPLAKLSAADLDRAYATLLASGGTVPAGPKPQAERKPRPLKSRTVLHVHSCLHTALEQAENGN